MSSVPFIELLTFSIRYPTFRTLYLSMLKDICWVCVQFASLLRLSCMSIICALLSTVFSSFMPSANYNIMHGSLCRLFKLEIELVLELTPDALYLWRRSNLMTFRLLRHVVFYCSVWILCVFSLAIRRLWGTLPKVFWKSRLLIFIALHLSYSLKTLFKISSRFVRQEHSLLKPCWVSLSTLFSSKLNG